MSLVTGGILDSMNKIHGRKWHPIILRIANGYKTIGKIELAERRDGASLWNGQYKWEKVLFKNHMICFL